MQAGTLIGLVMVLGWLWPFSRFVRNIVDEKETRIKEGMKMMGLSVRITSFASHVVTVM